MMGSRDRSARVRASACGGVLAVSLLWSLVAGAAEPPAADVHARILPGASEEELRARFGEALKPVAITPVRSAHALAVGSPPPDPDAPPAPDPYAGQLRLGRRGEPRSDIQLFEYDLFRGRVYRVRWRLAERFERPLMGPLVAHLTARLGAPDYDQTLQAKLGSGKSELRRSGWRRAGRWLEIRQIHPLMGGPLYVSVSDPAPLQAIVDARGVVLPQPESGGDWWRKPQAPPALLGAPERDTLLPAIDALLSPVGF